MRQEFFISAVPTGQARPKFARIGNHVHAYDPAKSKDYKADVKWQVIEQQAMPMYGPLTVTIDFYMPRPKAHYNSKGKLKQDAPDYHEKKPDLDNLTKGILDSLTGVIWNNDNIISVLLAIKRYSDKPGIKLVVQDCQ